MSVVKTMNQDEFLKPAQLFKKGPVFLIFAGLLLSFFVVWASLWRIEAGKAGVFDSAFKLLNTTSVASSGTISDLFSKVEYLVKVSEKVAEDESGVIEEAKILFSKDPLISNSVESLILSKEKNPIKKISFKEKLKAELHIPLLKEKETVLIVTLNLEKKLKEHLNAVTDYKGSIRLIDSASNSIVFNEKEFNDHKGNYLFDKSRFIEKSLDFDSKYNLAFSYFNKSYGFTTISLIPEKEYLKEFKERVKATWLIAFITISFISALVAVTGISLYRFSKEESYLRKLATIDILTDLPNRRSFKILLNSFLKESKKTPFALMFIDLDDFKFINDSVGHDQGDFLLKRTASAIKTAIRPGDRVCRLGGDEFTVLVKDIKNRREAEEVARRLLAELKKTVHIGGLELSPKSSIGVVLCPEHSQSEEDLLRFADIAMYKAKRDGKGNFCIFDESLQKIELENMELVKDLKEGLRLNQLYLVYQPKYAVVHGFKIVEGVEALIRWKHPKKGFISPAKFIPLAESHGLIGDIGHFVVQSAIDQIQEWNKKGFGWIKVAVNISALQLKDKDFVFKLTRLLAQKGVPPYCLQIEITEGILADDSVRIKDLIKDLNTFGIKVALDDFGTGYSCLSYLQQFPVDYLKIDRSFVNNIKTPQGSAICATIVQLSRAVNAKTIAEGVEDEEQLKLLLNMGCDQIQGFYLSKPLEVKDLEIQLMLQNVL